MDPEQQLSVVNVDRTPGEPCQLAEAQSFQAKQQVAVAYPCGASYRHLHDIRYATVASCLSYASLVRLVCDSPADCTCSPAAVLRCWLIIA